MYASSVTRTRSQSSTCTASRVETILDEVMGDVVAFVARGFLSRDTAVKWLSELAEVLKLEAISRFQLKLTLPDGHKVALEFEISDDGSLTRSDNCGGFSAYAFPEGTKVSITISYREGAANVNAAREFLRSRGWGPGSLVTGPATTHDRAYAKDGYGVRRRVIGEWPT